MFVLFSTLLAAVLRSFTGFGFAIATVPLLSFAFPPACLPVGLLCRRRAWCR
jgi:uncharacterized membrane protein YfcA